MKVKYSLMVSLVALITMQSLVSCVSRSSVVLGDGPHVSQRRPLSGFEKISIAGSPTVYYTQADSFSVRVEGPEDVVGQIETRVSDGELFIRNKGKLGIVNIVMADSDGLAVRVTSPDLIGVSLNGSGDFISKGHVDTDHLTINLSGSGDIRFSDIVCDDCVTRLIGSGDITIGRLECVKSVIGLTGSGDVEVHHKNVLQADVSLVGSGDIKLSGDVRELNKSRTGSGDITVLKKK